MTHRLALFLLALATVTMQAQQATSLAFQRANHLHRGINLSGWYEQTTDVSAARINAYNTPADFALIKSLGFDHVRLPIDPAMLLADNTPSLRPEVLALLDKSVSALNAAGLNVILDIHPADGWKTGLFKDDVGIARFIAFWTLFAQHFASTDPEKVFFEVLNEPTMDDLDRWQGIQARAIDRIRSIAPRHTIIATSAAYSHIDTLLDLAPVTDKNVIYTFHEYDPMWFTHQGATWGVPAWAFVHNVPYPSSPESILPILGQVTNDRPKLQLQRYGWDRWDAARLGMEVAAVSAWAQRRGVPLYCGEFGVYKAFADPHARATWISDARNALESKHIGWAMWDYQNNFSLVTKSPGKPTVADPAILTALGLTK
jgi:aryl-phospho-beta-D-glucosidase BglC (GH1 family)